MFRAVLAQLMRELASSEVRYSGVLVGCVVGHSSSTSGHCVTTG